MLGMGCPHPSFLNSYPVANHDIPNPPIVTEEGFAAAGYRRYDRIIPEDLWAKLAELATVELSPSMLEEVDLQAPGEGGGGSQTTVSSVPHWLPDDFWQAVLALLGFSLPPLQELEALCPKIIERWEAERRQHVVDIGGVQVSWTDAFRQWGKSLLATSDVVWKSGPLQLPDMKILRAELKKMGEAHKASEMNVTLCTHLWIDHLLGWPRRWGHIAIFAAFKGEGRHKALKCEISKHSFRGGSKGGRVSRLRGARVRVKGGKGDGTRKGWGEVIRSDNLDWGVYNKTFSIWESPWTEQRGYIENKGVFVQAEQGM